MAAECDTGSRHPTSRRPIVTITHSPGTTYDLPAPRRAADDEAGAPDASDAPSLSRRLGDAARAPRRLPPAVVAALAVVVGAAGIAGVGSAVLVALLALPVLLVVHQH